MASVFDGNRVSPLWRSALTAARADGVLFRVNDGQRLMSEQARLYAQNMNPATRRPRPGRPLTAKPNPNAPHIKEGREDHAIDVNDEDLFNGTKGGADNLIRWADGNGARLVRTVRSEAWHLEIEGGEKALRSLVVRLAFQRPKFTRAEARTVALITKVRSRRSTPARRTAIRAYKLAIRGYRAALKIAAKRSGWGRKDRSRRYLALGDIYNGRGA